MSCYSWAPALCARVAAQLKAKFALTSMGGVKYLLGIEITLDGVPKTSCLASVLTSKNSSRNLFSRILMGAGHRKLQLSHEQWSKQTDIPYRKLVGQLQYLVSGSRPDIAHAVRHLGKFLSCYTEQHYREVERVLRYLLQTRDYALHLDIVHGDNVDILVFTDSDYANDPDDVKLVSDDITFLDGNVIAYGSRKQGINA
ncbi:unnamed protein product [Phytophthora fragariaefolia]|uniref:Unnamed protein product n=1 Tax=Phytophthora fragariaefolia TaxID=1490495 RepID=A0A9W6XSQ9_9STRA|nr:unnamed protein product [Phytophthora fragariaefolia]